MRVAETPLAHLYLVLTPRAIALGTVGAGRAAVVEAAGKAVDADGADCGRRGEAGG